MQQEYILVTCVGNTDPMRNNSDGPIMHIVRHYKPKKIKKNTPRKGTETLN